MARIHGQVGSLNHLIELLRESGIYGFETLDSIRKFRASYKDTTQKIRENSRARLSQDIANLESKYQKLSSDLNNRIKRREDELFAELRMLRAGMNATKPPTNFLGRVVASVKNRRISKRKAVLESSFRSEVERPFRRSLEDVARIQSDIKSKKTNTERWAEIYASNENAKHQKTLSIFQTNRSLFYGAEGEERALQELSKLPDSYTVINDYRLKFAKPIYNRRGNDRIYSVQIDHIVIGPTGIYLVETKNWSKDSVESRDLFSPVKQLNRHSFAMFVLLNDAVTSGGMWRVFSGNWGDRKISPRNIILLMNHKPREEYQHVKILSITELARYVSYGTSTFSETEVETLADYLLSLQVRF